MRACVWLCLAALVAGVSGRRRAEGECYFCFGGYSSQGPSKNCSSCPAGECTLPQNCSLCRAGTYSEDNEASCSPCPAGSFAAQAGSSVCVAAPPGFTTVAPFTQATPCPAGTYESERTCLDCPLGHFSASGSVQCFECPPGTFGSSPPGAGCTPCPEATFNADSGQSQAGACVAVQKGFFALAGAVAASQCPPSFYCDGTSLPQPCLPFFDSQAGSGACDATVWLFVFIPCAAVTGLVVVAMIWLFASGFFGRRPTINTTVEAGEEEKLLSDDKAVTYMGL